MPGRGAKLGGDYTRRRVGRMSSLALHAPVQRGGGAAGTTWVQWLLSEDAGTAAIVLGALTVTATAVISSSGSASITLGDLTLSATATITIPVTATPEAAPDLTWQASYHYGVTVAPAYTSRITVAQATRTRTEG